MRDGLPPLAKPPENMSKSPLHTTDLPRRNDPRPKKRNIDDFFFLLCLLGVDRESTGFPCERAFGSFSCNVSQVVEVCQSHQTISNRTPSWGSAKEERTQNFTVHHHLPSINGQIRIVEAPVELFSRSGLVRRVVVRRQVFVCETVRRVDTCSRVKDEHLFEQVEGYKDEGISCKDGCYFGVDVPRGSALGNFLLNGTRSRFGKL